MKKELNIRFEKAVRLLSEHFPVSDETTRKPVLFHDIRVGVFLYERNYAEPIVLAGVLHDALEFSDLSEEFLRTEFGDRVVELVKACTKDPSITDKEASTDELIKRCAETGEDALIVKCADIIDSFKFYTAENNEAQLEYCRRNALAIFKYKPENYHDKVFDELRSY
jgi:(p)ppGpp synthase/HD superfamily hydrolase